MDEVLAASLQNYPATPHPHNPAATAGSTTFRRRISLSQERGRRNNKVDRTVVENLVSMNHIRIVTVVRLGV